MFGISFAAHSNMHFHLCQKSTVNRYTLCIIAILLTASTGCSKKAGNTITPPPGSGHAPVTMCYPDTSRTIYVPAHKDTTLIVPVTVYYDAFLPSTITMTIGILPSLISVDHLSDVAATDTMTTYFTRPFSFHIRSLDTGIFRVPVTASSYNTRSGSYDRTAVLKFNAR